MSAEQTYKTTSHFMSQCVSTMTSLMKILLRSRLGIKLPEADNSSCIILGNGPSLKTSLLHHEEILKKSSLVCVNSFSITEEYTLLQPHYYVILDNGFWVSDAKIILNTLEAIKTKTTWPIHLFIPKQASKSKRFEELAQANPNIQLNYYNYTVFNGFDTFAHWLYSKNLAMPQSQNVLVASIFLCINMGFKKIQIVGADHTWHQNLHVDEQNVVCIRDTHFYETEEKISYIPFKKGLHLTETFKMHEIFATWSKAFYGYIALEKYASYKHSKIYNASEITFIDAFERIKL